MLKAGERIGPYVVVRLLGEGGMGEVYLAEHRLIGRRAAVKILRRELAVQEAAVARFFKEARAVSMIEHPGIVEIFECDIDANGCAFIAMEYLEGESLEAALVRAGSLRSDLATAMAVTAQITAALSAAHQQGIVHRDLKPANIFLAAPKPGQTSGGPLVKVLDFGIAKLAVGSDAKLTQTGSLLGTPVYMSPEQCRGDTAIDHRADVYSLGCMLYEMIAGHTPFPHRAAGALFVAHVTEAPPPLAESAPGVPPAIEQTVMAMLAKRADDRPQSMAEVAARLQAGGLHGSAIVAPRPSLEPPRRATGSAPQNQTPATVVLRDDPAKLTTFTQVASAIVAPTMVRPKRPWGWLVGGAGILAGAVGVVLAMGAPSSGPAAPTAAVERELAMPAAVTPDAASASDEVVPAPPVPAKDPALDPARTRAATDHVRGATSRGASKPAAPAPVRRTPRPNEPRGYTKFDD